MRLRIKLEVSAKRYEEAAAFLAAHGIETSDDGEFVLRERGRFPDRLTVRDQRSGERVLLPASEVVCVESFRHAVEVVTQTGVYRAGERLYQLLALLDPEEFLRISNSVVIAKSKVARIAPTLSMKFILTLSNGKKVDVTRSYYYIFKEAFGL